MVNLSSQSLLKESSPQKSPQKNRATYYKAITYIIAGLPIVLGALSGISWNNPLWADPYVGNQLMHFISVPNFRDLAGDKTGYRGADGKHMRSGLIFRSSKLEPSPQDLAIIEQLKITEVYDLRTTREEILQPDTLIPGTKYNRINIVGNDFHDSYSQIPNADYVHKSMEDFYRNFVRSSYERGEFAEAVKDILHAHGAIVYHCSAGKDRTGWLSVILLSALGVSPQDIETNYLLTNSYTHMESFPFMESTRKQIRWEFNYADPDYLHAGLAEITKLYGTMDNYLRKGLGLDTTVLNALKAKYLY